MSIITTFSDIYLSTQKFSIQVSRKLQTGSLCFS